jgi:V/A-type H+-transporting ATPase subunit I
LCQTGEKEKNGKKDDGMIVRMKEVWLFTLSSSVDDTVQELGKLGVLEIREVNAPEGEAIERNEQKARRVRKAMSILEKHTSKNEERDTRIKYSAADPTRVTNRTLVAVKFRKECSNKLNYLEQQRKWYEIWGKNTKPKDIGYLAQKGIHIRLYLVEKKYLNSIPEDKCVVRFPEQDGKIPLALVSRDASEKLAFKEEPLPHLPLATIQQQIARKTRQLEAVDFYLTDQSESIALLQEHHDYLQDLVNTRKVLEGMGNIEGHIKFLRGFIPHDAVEAFKHKAKQEKWGYQISEPEEPDEVPVYIKNPKWISIINPVLRFIDIVPGYKEVDVSIYFLIAFALFFAMLVGDAGYGAIFLLITLLIRKKIPGQLRTLIYVLSGATIMWGVLSGTYFGSEAIASIPVLENLIIPEIASFGVDNIAFMMHLSFLIGAIHLTIAHSIRAAQLINSIRVLSEVGWILLVWGLFFVVETLVLGKTMPAWGHWLFIAGAALVAFFSKEGKTFVGSVLTSIGNLPLSLINGFSDIVSYVRLFAVGMATAMVAASFNNMILPEEGSLSFLEIPLAAVALILGHGMNIVLALMAVMVHGIRLNMLEFAGHLGVQFSGEAYNPFTLKTARKEIEN